MGNRSSKSSLRNAIVHLNISAETIRINDDKFWSQIWTEDMSSAGDIIRGISTQEIRMLRDGSPQNFATLTYKMVERLCLATGTLCNTQSQQTAVLNATRILIRLIPCIFEDEAWFDYFHKNSIQTASSEEPKLVYPEKDITQRDYSSYLPSGCRTRSTITMNEVQVNDKSTDLLESKISTINLVDRTADGTSLASSLILSICDLLFCPEFTVPTHSNNHLYSSVDAPPEDLRSLATCDYVWEPGIGFESNVNSTTYYDKNRSELLRLLLASLSSTLYRTPNDSVIDRNYSIEILASNSNRHALPLFTSLLNTIFIYRSTKLLPFNNLLFNDTREELVELSIQILIATLDYQFEKSSSDDQKNLFIEYMSRIHRSEDFVFLIKGFTRLLNYRLEQGYLINSIKHINFDQELLILFWRISNLNKKFINYLLKSNEILDIVVPILYHLNENFQDTSKTALIHIGVFNLLILSGERNFGVRLNKPYLANVLLNLPTFTGSHADLIIIMAHKLILYGQNLNQLYDFLLTIIVNISPYLKAISILASKCLIQLFDIFSSSFIIFTEPNYHQMVIFLLEIFNNLVQYQFDGNANLVYTIISKKDTFLNLANLTTTQNGIQKVINKLIKKKQRFTMFEKTLSEQDQDKNREDVSSSISDRDGSRMQNMEFSYKNDATVSSDLSPSNLNNNLALRQGVSLVPTPGICHVTQPIHPFDTESKSSEASVPKRDVDCTSPSFENLLDQSNDSRVCTSLTKNDATQSLLDIDPFDQNSNDGLRINNSQLNDCSQQLDTSVSKTLERWRPTPEWVKSWKSSLPLHTMLRMIEVLNPQIERFQQGEVGIQTEIETIKFLQNGTLVGLLPVPHPIVIRRYRTNGETTLWFRACTWGIIYVRNTTWTDTHIRLIKVV